MFLNFLFKLDSNYFYYIFFLRNLPRFQRWKRQFLRNSTRWAQPSIIFYIIYIIWNSKNRNTKNFHWLRFNFISLQHRFLPKLPVWLFIYKLFWKYYLEPVSEFCSMEFCNMALFKINCKFWAIPESFRSFDHISFAFWGSY